MAKTAVVILNWNGIEYLRMFLPKVIEYTMNETTDLYVADNGSTDGSADWVASNHKDVKLIRFEKNYGFSGGYNLALEKINAEYFALLNSDIEVTEGWLEPLIKHLDENPDTASCQPKIRSYHHKEYFEYAGAAGGFIDKYGYPLCRGRILTKIEKDKGQYDSPAYIFWSTGACMAIRSEIWKKCGGFDPDFFAHMEEIDLCWRIHRAGYRVSFVSGSEVYHVGGGALPYSSPFKTYLNFRNSLFLLYKNLPDKNLRKIMFIRKLLDGLAALFFLFKGQFRSVRAVWKAHIDFYKKIDSVKSGREIVRLLGEKEATEWILNKCIVFEFYIKRNRTFNSLVKKKRTQ
ncbi:MAG: glycosyltransferase family 2 protein [Bacteroidales bacterium]|nr:glycosyltransferase family 2 protein [Bacteroidales bacterium]